jgi:hypothetical protein
MIESIVGLGAACYLPIVVAAGLAFVTLAVLDFCCDCGAGERRAVEE